MKTSIPTTSEAPHDAGKESIGKRLAAHPFVAGMSEKHLGILADCTMATHFEPGQIIFRAGEPANGFYLIESGKVVLEEPQPTGEPMMIDVVSTGEPLGWSWLFSPLRLAIRCPGDRALSSLVLVRHHAAATSR